MKRMLTIIELRHTDLPEPVVPATRRCGIFARSAQIMLPVISLPSATVSLLFESLNSGVSMISRIVTMDFALLGTSIPIADLPGIGASIRTLVAARRRAISSERLVILLILTPASGTSSYLVTEGPRQILVTSALILKLSRVEISFLAPSCISAMLSVEPSFSARSRQSTGG